MQDALDDAAFEIWLAAQAECVPAPKKESATATPLPETDMDEVAKVRPREEFRPPLQQSATRNANVSLLESQQIHVTRLNGILDKFPFALDMSMLGAGKTYTSTHIAISRGYKHVIVVCPMSVMPKWKMIHATYNIPIKHILGYQALRSVKFKQPKHGLLHRRDFEAVGGGSVEFTPTSYFLKLVDEGLLLIFDEVQNIKNVSSQFLAAQALIRAITLRHGSLMETCRPGFVTPPPVITEPPRHTFFSHALLLSASPIDKTEQALHVFRVLGVMTDDRIAQYNIHTQSMDWRGLHQIQDFCQALHGRAVARVNWESLEMHAYRLFQLSFKLHISSSMPPPSVQTRLRKRNAFYNIDKEGEEIVKRGLSTLQTAAHWDGSQIHFVSEGTTAQMASVTRSLQIIETGKISLFARVAREALAEPTQKVVLAVNFSDTVTDLVELLKEHKPLLLTGSCTEKQRAETLRLFQEPSPTHRLLICNQSVASTGIDLDDKLGKFPRLALVSPNYSTIMSYQLGHRFQRLDTKSDARVHFVFAKRRGCTRQESRDIIEIGVLDALSRKSTVMRETAALGASSGVVFPGDHEEWIEGESNPLQRADVDD